MSDGLGVVSLFSGVGGFDVGFEQAGFSTVFQCEWDRHASSVLARHFPDVPRWGDISTLSGEQIVQMVTARGGTPDVVIWGSPCQDLSFAGKRAGLDGARSGLFHEGIRIINEIRRATDGRYPRVSVWENVAGALSSAGGADFGTVLREMGRMGSCLTEWAVLDAQFFGVPQRRRRVFVVAVLDPATAERCANPLLPVGEGVRRNPKKSRQASKGAATSSASSVGDGNREIVGLVTTGMTTPMTVQPVLLTDREGKPGGGKGALLSVDKSLSLRTSNAQVLFSSPIGFSHTQGLSAQPSETVFPTLRSEGSGQAVAEPSVVMPALTASNDPSRSPQSSEVPQQVTAVYEETMTVRRLTPIECERLMGWADDWTRYTADGREQADSHRYKQCGNGVASPVARWIAEHLRQVL
jgi:DNA (cytosine-5)-methyltransferase 1